MNSQQHSKTQNAAQAISLSRRVRIGRWVQDPLGSVIAASVGTIGSLGVVLSSIWVIDLALN